MDPMVAELHAIADTTYLPTYTDPLQLAQAMHALHMSNMLGYDGAENEGVNDIDTTLMAPNVPNADYTLGGTPTLQAKLRTLIQQYSDIFSYSVKGKAMDVPQWSLQLTTQSGKQTRIERPQGMFPQKNMSHWMLC
jgi:hypothetical protein